MESVRNTSDIVDEAANSYTKTPQAMPRLHQPTAKAPVAPKALPSYPARDCGNCFPEGGLHIDKCHRAFAATLQRYIQAAKDALLPQELNSEGESHGGENRSEQFKRSGKHQLLSLVSLEPGQHPTSNLANLTELAIAFKLKEAAQVQEFNEKQVILDNLHSTMLSSYQESSDGYKLFREWHEAMEDYYKCCAEKWILKEAMEEMCEQAVEESKKRLAATTEQHYRLLAEHEQAALDLKAAELEVQDERIASLEAELLEVKERLLDLEAEREAN